MSARQTCCLIVQETRIVIVNLNPRSREPAAAALPAVPERGAARTAVHFAVPALGDLVPIPERERGLRIAGQRLPAVSGSPRPMRVPPVVEVSWLSSVSGDQPVTASRPHLP